MYSWYMLPVLFTIFGQPISSFGFFLSLAFIVAGFIIWRIINVYEIDEEKAIDLVLLTILISLVSARLYYVLFHLSQFDQLQKVLLINHYPGLSFWGGIIGGGIGLYFLSKRFKVQFWQISDYATVGLFSGLVVGNLGCFLGSCAYGLESRLFGVIQIGIIGKRFPIQIVEALMFLVFAIFLWRQVLKFHFAGQITAKGLIILGIIKLIMEFFRGDRQFISGLVSLGLLFALGLIGLGVTIYYQKSKRILKDDVKLLGLILIEDKKRKWALSKLHRNWYDWRVNLRVRMQNNRRALFKLLNVKSNPKKF